MRPALMLATCSMLTACTSERLLSGDDADASTSASTSAPSATMGAASDSTSNASTDGSTSTTTSADSSSSALGDSEGCALVCAPDLGDAIIENCDLWAQDCPLGQKCMPWANDSGNAWNGTRCSPIADDPAQAGEPCTVEGSNVSGIDDCDLASMCWYVDETNAGVCVDLCRGSQQDPVCLDAISQCTIFNEGNLILCLPLCDPRLQDCRDGEACYPVYDFFTCSPDANPLGTYGDPCEFVNACDPGFFCGSPDDVPECAGSLGCCNVFCDLAVDDPESVCPDAAQGQTCVPWFDPGEAPPGFETLGSCVLR